MKQKIRYSKRNVLSLILALCMIVTMIPQMAFAGNGSDTDPYTFQSDEGIVAYLCDKDGNIKESATPLTTGDTITLNADKNEITYIKVLYKNGNEIKKDDYVQKTSTKSDVVSINKLRVNIKHSGDYLGYYVVNGVKVNDGASVNADLDLNSDGNIIAIDSSQIENSGKTTVTVRLCYDNSGKVGLTGWVTSGFNLEFNKSEGEEKNPVEAIVFPWGKGPASIPFGTEYTIPVTLTTAVAGETTDEDTSITVTSTNQNVVADADIKCVPNDDNKKHLNYNITFTPKKEISYGESFGIKVTYNANDSICDTTYFYTKRTYNDFSSIGIMIPGSVAEVKYGIYPTATASQEVKWVCSDTNILKIDDIESGKLVIEALKPGNVTLTGTSVEDPNVVFEYETTVGNPGIKIQDSVDAEYSEDIIDWDVSKQDSELQLYAYLDSAKKANAFWASSNTDVAEVSKIGEGNDGKVSLKKNGTVTIYAIYNYSNQGYPILGKVTINVKGCGETADIANWDTLDSSQSYDGTETSSIYAYIRLTSHGVESNSFNNAFFQNQITELIPAKDAEFTFLIGSRNPDTNFNEEIYLNSLLSNVYICKINDNGERGDIVATYNKGYTLKSVDYENGSSGQGTGVAVAIPTIKVDSGILNKGAKYALVVERSAKAPDGARLYKDAEYKFKTVGGAQIVDITDADGNELENLTLEKAETSDIQAVMKLKEYKVAPDDTVNWESDNPDVADVEKVKEANGISFAKVTAKAPGKAVITAAAEDGEGSDSCTVTVPGIDLKNTKITLTEGDTYKLNADLYSDDQQLKIEWSSSNEDVATVDEGGNITAFSAGEAIITGTAGEYTAETIVTVKAAPEGYNPVSDVDQDGDDGTSDNDSDSDSSAGTGDNMNIWMLIALLAASGAAGTAALKKRAKQ